MISFMSILIKANMPLKQLMLVRKRLEARMAIRATPAKEEVLNQRRR
jgi:hypothetical protein